MKSDTLNNCTTENVFNTQQNRDGRDGQIEILSKRILCLSLQYNFNGWNASTSSTGFTFPGLHWPLSKHCVFLANIRCLPWIIYPVFMILSCLQSDKIWYGFICSTIRGGLQKKTYYGPCSDKNIFQIFLRTAQPAKIPSIVKKKSLGGQWSPRSVPVVSPSFSWEFVSLDFHIYAAAHPPTIHPVKFWASVSKPWPR